MAEKVQEETDQMVTAATDGDGKRDDADGNADGNNDGVIGDEDVPPLPLPLPSPPVG